MTDELFRPEVAKAKQNNWLGSVSVAQPVFPWIVAILALCVLAAVAGFLISAQYAQRSRVSGHLVPDRGMSVVIAPAAGIVGQIYVNEGDLVRAQQQIGLVYVPQSIASGREASDEIERNLEIQHQSVIRAGMARIEELDAREQGYRRKLDVARRELSQLAGEIGTRKAQVRLGEELVSRYKTVVEQQYVSVVQLRQQEQAVLELKGAQQALERQETMLFRDMSELEQGLLELRAQRGELAATERRDLAALNQERVKQEVNAKMLLRAPVGGIISNRLVEPGQAVEAGQSVATLLPNDSLLQAQLLVPSRAIGFIQTGDVVLLRYEAFPYQKFGLQRGRVLRISRSTVDGANFRASSVESRTDAYYRVLVALDSQSVKVYGKEERLRPGMQLEADVLTEKRRLYEWLIEPLYAVKGLGD